MNDFEQIIILLAEKYKESEQFIDKLESTIDKVPQQEIGNFLLEIGNILFKYSHFILALDLWNYALKYLRDVKDKAGESECYGYIGNAYNSIGDFRQAIKYHHRSMEIAKELRDRDGESICYGNLGSAYRNLGDYQKAIEYHEMSLEIKKDIKDKAGESACYTNLGNVYLTLGDYQNAKKYLEMSLEIKKDIKDKAGESACYTNLGIAHHKFGDLTKAIEYLEKSLQIVKDVKNRTGESACYTNLGNAYYSLGEYRKSIEYHEKSLEMKKAIKDRAGESRCYIGLGNVYSSLGDQKKAIDYCEKSLEIKKDIEDKYGEIACYTSLGVAYNRSGDFRRAITSHKRSLEVALYIKDKAGESRCFTGLGNAYYSLGEYRKAIEYYVKSMEIALAIEDRAVQSKCYTNLGNAYSSLGDFRQAIKHHEKSLEVAENTGDMDLERLVNQNLGASYYDQNPDLAYKYLIRSIDLSEVIGKGLLEEEHKIGFYGRTTQAYEFMIPLCMRLNKEEEAFHYTERSKSKTFLDMLAATNVRPSDELMEQKTLVEKEEASLTRLREVQMRHLRKTQVTTDLGEVDRIIKELNEIYDEMEKIDPEYVFMRQARPLSLNKLEEMLSSEKRNSVVVEYFITKDKVFIFVVSKDGLHAEPVSLSAERLLRYINSYQREVVHRADYGAIGDTWLEMSNYLIEPISDYLVKSDLIYFIPYSALHYLPMHALELHGEPLIKNHPVCYSPAASIIRFCKNKGTDRLEDCAPFGIVFEDEAEEVAKLFKTKPYLGKQACKKNVIKNVNRDIIHLSCHGYFDNLDPLSSGVLLHNEEVLTAREIFNMKVNSELVTLSACQTGLNKTKPGDELIGLTRALLYAGAPSVIVSLWSVFAPSTQELMLEFYKLLKKGKDKATALQEAQKEIMKKDEYAHPYFWAPFILVGDWE